MCFLTIFFLFFFFAPSHPSIRQAHHPHTQPLSSLHRDFSRPLFLTNLFCMFNSIRFVLWPTDFSQGHLCSRMFGVTLWSQEGSAVGRQDSSFTSPRFYPGQCSAVSSKAPCALPLLGLMVDIPRMGWSSVGWPDVGIAMVGLSLEDGTWQPFTLLPFFPLPQGFPSLRVAVYASYLELGLN